MTIRFAVTGMERSGTMWLSLVLDDDPNVKVYHEPAPLKAWDGQVFAMTHDGTLDAASFVKARYNYWLYTSPNHQDKAEVNSVIRYVAGVVRDVWEIPVAAIVRDGRLTVRSLMKRGTFQRQGMPGFEPPAEIADDPFACCCWYWADAYERLEQQGIPVWRLEDLNENEAEFDRLCEFLGITVRKAAWDWLAGQPAHASIAQDTPLDWDEQQAATFDRWAGAMQENFGYERAA